MKYEVAFYEPKYHAASKFWKPFTRLHDVINQKTAYVEIKCQLDATEVFIADLIACSTCFGHHYAHHQELKSIILWLLPVVFGAYPHTAPTTLDAPYNKPR